MAGCIEGIRNAIAKLVGGGMILAPIFPNALVHRVFFVMEAYLTNGWRLSFTYAAGIMNIWEGMGLVLPTLFQFLADTFLGNFVVAVISAIFSTAGIGMVALSVPRILEHYGGRCRVVAEAESCINDTEKALFFTGMVLTALGRAGTSFSLEAFHDQQIQSTRKTSCSCLRNALQNYIDFVVWTDKLVIYLIGSLFILIWIRKWKILFGIPAIYSAYVLVWFLLGCCLSDRSRSRPEGSPITTAWRVVRNPETEEDKQTARFVVRMIPISITFIFCGVVSSIGNTYFVEQANHMNRRVGKWNAPLLALQLPVILFKTIQDFYLYLFYKIDKDWIRSRLKLDLPISGIGGAMIYSVLCCATAAIIEKKRLGVIKRHDLTDMPDDVEIPMHAAWLLFQFFLLAGLDSFLRKSIEEFYKDQAPMHLKSKLGEDRATMRYLTSAVDFVSGLGFLSSVFSVYVVGKLSEIGGRPSWFQCTLNRSRLDRYYWALAGLSGLNLIVFNLVALGYRTRPSGETTRHKA